MSGRAEAGDLRVQGRLRLLRRPRQEQDRAQGPRRRRRVRRRQGQDRRAGRRRQCVPQGAEELLRVERRQVYTEATMDHNAGAVILSQT